MNVAQLRHAFNEACNGKGPIHLIINEEEWLPLQEEVNQILKANGYSDDDIFVRQGFFKGAVVHDHPSVPKGIVRFAYKGDWESGIEYSKEIKIDEL